MKRVVAAIGLTALLVLAGCGGSLKPGFTGPGSSRSVTWQDGDPLVPLCGKTGVFNCKKDYTIHDRMTDAQITLSITDTSFTPPTTDDYEIRANGYDWQGYPISSAYLAIPK